MQDELLTAQEVAEKIGVSIRSVQRYCKHGLLNYKWIHGKRHRELRIVPPIPVTLLPGVKKGSAGESDFVSRGEFESLSAAFRGELARRDDRIAELERALGRSTASSTGGGMESGPLDPGIVERAEAVVEEYEKVRPVEKKLILALARTVRAQEEFLKTLGMPENSD